MKFKDLSATDLEVIKKTYELSSNKDEAQKQLSKMYNVSKRSIRTWAKKLKIGGSPTEFNLDHSKVMIYDIETSQVSALVWWSGKQFIHSRQLLEEPKIITVSWKWLGEDEVHWLTWDKDKCDKALMKDFLVEYNKADLVIGFNNNNFDNRWVNARAFKHQLEVNTFVRSLDLMKEEKRLMRMVGYSLDYSTQYSGVVRKQSHEGMIMWDKIQRGTPEEAKEYLEKMVEYNIGDIMATEELYYRLRKYIGHQVHLGVLNGEAKFSCPNCASTDVELDKTTYTAAGTIQHIMRCKKDRTSYKISNRDFLKFIDFKIEQDRED